MLRGHFVLRGPFEPYAKFGWVAHLPFEGDNAANPYGSQVCLFEDGQRLLNGHAPHWLIDCVGNGRYSHWEKRLFFSTLDHTDPNTNGRVYSFDLSLDQQTWNRERLSRSGRRWDWHPRKDYFRNRGGDLIPPPLTCNIGLTNKCNLRCEICGSQKHLDETGIRRRHMQLKVFEAVAETMFPFLSVVELNSQGDPLLHPNIDTVLTRIAQHGCDIKVQHNGTLLSEKINDLLMGQHGTINLSLDAVGSRFDDVRRGGTWQKAEPGLIRLLSNRNPRRLSVGIYPTLTRRTIGEALNVLDWSAEHGADVVAFHRYSPVQGSFEQAPTENEYDTLKSKLARWCAQNNDALRVLFESECFNAKEPPPTRDEFASMDKAIALGEFPSVLFPTENSSSAADPVFICTAPRDYVEIGLEGQVSVCCRSQDVPLGYATSAESFADIWLGSNYKKIRASLARGATGPYPLPNCEGCIKFFAPMQAGERHSIEYDCGMISMPVALEPPCEIRIEEIHKEVGFCNLGTLPPGVSDSAFDLWEDDLRLGPSGTLHDEIRERGSGRYHFNGRTIYFSTSDGSDAQRNERIYTVRRR